MRLNRFSTRVLNSTINVIVRHSGTFPQEQRGAVAAQNSKWLGMPARTSAVIQTLRNGGADIEEPTVPTLVASIWTTHDVVTLYEKGVRMYSLRIASTVFAGFR